ncbi:MAG: tol-pal system YbgF family protein [Phycisphaerae bacterium]
MHATTHHYRLHWIPVCLLAMAPTILSGCNIDGLWAKRGEPDGPTAPQTAKHGRPGKAIDLAVVRPEEVDLVEALIDYRRRYHDALEQLRGFYESRGYATKLAWAEFELHGLAGVKPFRYLLDAEVPSESLAPTASIEQADQMYEKALALMKKGGHGVPALFRQDVMVQASELFRDLIVQFPSSDKIDDAAFFLGEIHKEYLPNQETIALKWYDRAWTWNPNTPHPARFQAAVVCDFRLHDRDRALELYQEVVDHETKIESNVRFAMRRIYELTLDAPDGARASVDSP